MSACPTVRLAGHGGPLVGAVSVAGIVAVWPARSWLTSAPETGGADCNRSASRFRPQTRQQVEHRDRLELLDELKAIEAEILEEIDALADALREKAA